MLTNALAGASECISVTEARSRDREPAQVAVRRQHEPRTQDTVGRHSRLCRADLRGFLIIRSPWGNREALKEIAGGDRVSEREELDLDRAERGAQAAEFSGPQVLGEGVLRFDHRAG